MDRIFTLQAKLKSLHRRRKKYTNRINKKISETAEELRKLREQMRNVEPIECTPEIATYWGIPKINADRKTILNSTVYDILPARCPRGSKHKGKGVIGRLHGICWNGLYTVADVVQMRPDELKRQCRGFGQTTIEVLRYCLTWNGLSFGMDIDESDIDPLLEQTTAEFLADVPIEIREPILQILDPNDNCVIKMLLVCSRKSLAGTCGCDNSMLDLIEKKLAEHNRMLRPDI